MQAKKAELRGLYKLFPASYDIQRGIEHVERQLRQGGLSLREEKAMVSSIPRLKSLQRLQEQFGGSQVVRHKATALRQGSDPKKLEEFNNLLIDSDRCCGTTRRSRTVS